MGISAVDVFNILFFKSTLQQRVLSKSNPKRPLYLGSKSNIKNLWVILLLKTDGSGRYATKLCLDLAWAVLTMNGSYFILFSKLVPIMTLGEIKEHDAPVSIRNMPPNSGKLIYPK